MKTAHAYPAVARSSRQLAGKDPVDVHVTNRPAPRAVVVVSRRQCPDRWSAGNADMDEACNALLADMGVL